MSQKEELAFVPVVTQGFYLQQPFRELLHPCTSTTSFLSQLYSSITKIVTTALPELSPPGELLSGGNYTTASDNPVLIPPCYLRCVVPYQRLHFLALNLTFSTCLPGKESKLWLLPSPSPPSFTLPLPLSFRSLLLTFRGGSVKVLPAKFAVTLRSHRHLIHFFFLKAG